MILIMGMPGAGKSVQSQLLQDRLGLHWASTGRLLRGLNDSEVNAVLDRGDLMPDDEVIRLLSSTLKDIGYDRTFLLDGFPRNASQAKWLIEHAEELGKTVKGVIFLNIDDETAIKRMLGRGRSDDADREVLENRRNEFAKIEPTINYLASHNIPMHMIDASGDVETVFLSVQTAVGYMTDGE